MRFRKVLMPLAAVAAAALIIACGSGDPSSAPAGGPSDKGADKAADAAKGPATVKAGAGVNITTGSGDKLTVTVADPKAGVSSGNQFLTPKKGQFFTVTVSVQYVSGTDTYLANPGDVKLVTADGTVYQAEFVSSIEPEFPTVNLNAGQKASGKVVFDVPKTVKIGSGAKIQFDGSWDGKAAAFWTV